MGNTNLKGDLRELYITAAKSVVVDDSKSAIIMFVPFKLLKAYHKIQKTLVEELEKKFRCVHLSWRRRCFVCVSARACDEAVVHVRRSSLLSARLTLPAFVSRYVSYACGASRHHCL